MRIPVNIVREVIRLAEAARAARRAKYPRKRKHLLERTLADISDEEMALLPEEQALRRFVHDQPDSTKAKVTAIMWLGAGYGNVQPEDLKDLVERASRDLKDITTYLTQKRPLAKYLRAGMKKLGKEV